MHNTGLPGPARNLLLTVHIGAAVGVIGADLVLLALGIAGLRGGDPRTIYPDARLVLHMVPEARRILCLQEASRILAPGGRLLLIDYAGDPRGRRQLSARHGPHGRFDLYRFRQPLADAGFEGIEGGPLDWLSLHFLRGIRL